MSLESMNGAVCVQCKVATAEPGENYCEPCMKTCACGAEKHACREGCDDCEHDAHMAFAAARPTPILPDGWWRRFEPIGGCAAAYNYGRSDIEGVCEGWDGPPGKPKKDCEIVYACKYGVQIENKDAGSERGHLSAETVFALVAILNLAVQDHLALKAFENPQHDDSCGYGEAFEKAVAEAAAKRIAKKASTT